MASQRELENAISEGLLELYVHSRGEENPYETKLQNVSLASKSDWEEHKTDSGDVYYFNAKTGASSWERPDEVLSPTTKDWVECKTDDGLSYYFNPVTEESVWELPHK